MTLAAAGAKAGGQAGTDASHRFLVLDENEPHAERLQDQTQREFAKQF